MSLLVLAAGALIQIAAPEPAEPPREIAGIGFSNRGSRIF